MERRRPVPHASPGLSSARKHRTCQLPARMRVPSPAIPSLRSLYAAYGLVSASVGGHKPKTVENGGSCVPQGPREARRCAEERPGGLAKWWPKTPCKSHRSIAEANWELGWGPEARRTGAGRGAARQHVARPAWWLGVGCPPSRGGRQALGTLTLAYINRGPAHRGTRCCTAPAAHAGGACAQGEGRHARAVGSQACRGPHRPRSSSTGRMFVDLAASSGLKAHQPVAAAAAARQPRHLPHSLLRSLQILGQRRQLPLAGLPSDDLHSSKNAKTGVGRPIQQTCRAPWEVTHLTARAGSTFAGGHPVHLAS